jgi:hypothetical protein
MQSTAKVRAEVAVVANPCVVSSQLARARGLPRYFTGKPCKNGHVAARYTKCRNCVECNPQRASRHPRVEDMTPDQLRRYEAAKRRASLMRLRAKFKRLWGVQQVSAGPPPV